MPTRLKKLLILPVAFAFTPMAAHACRCMGPKPSTDVLISSHSLVFIGHAVSSKLILGPKGRFDAYTEFTFVPVEIFKGNPKAKEFKMLTHGTTCDENYQLGVDYVIYANESGNEGFYASTCDYPKFLRFADVDDESKKVREATRRVEAAEKPK
ncbi:MAG: hypothetical protein AB1457_18490 [Chloroflexota bacterium]